MNPLVIAFEFRHKLRSFYWPGYEYRAYINGKPGEWADSEAEALIEAINVEEENP